MMADFSSIPEPGGRLTVAGRLDVRVLTKAVWRATADAPRPDVSFVPAMERRRLTALERAAIAVAHRAVPEPAGTPVVFASRWGEIGTTLKLMRQFREEGEMSPAGFASSVHNAAPGAFSLLTGNRAAYTAIAAGEETFSLGLLEAAAMSGRVLFVFAEEETPAFYRTDLSEPLAAQALAVLLERL